MQLNRKIDTPADLINYCESVGAEVRSTTGGGYLIKGPAGSTTIPARWDHGRGRCNVLAELRRTGLDLSALAPEQRVRPTASGDQVQEFSKLHTTGGRPSLVLTKADEPEPEEETVPESATKADLDALFDLVETLSGRITVLSRRLDKLEATERTAAESAPPKEPTSYDICREVRKRIMELFVTLPPNMKMNAGTVAGSLDVPDEERGRYRDQLNRLVEMGELIRHGGSRVGSNALYSLPVQGEVEA